MPSAGERSKAIREFVETRCVSEEKRSYVRRVDTDELRKTAPLSSHRASMPRCHQRAQADGMAQPRQADLARKADVLLGRAERVARHRFLDPNHPRALHRRPPDRPQRLSYSPLRGHGAVPRAPRFGE